MQKIVYKAKYFCDLCANDVTTNIYGESDHNFSKDEESEAIEWAKHFHWIEKHPTYFSKNEFIDELKSVGFKISKHGGRFKFWVHAVK